MSILHDDASMVIRALDAAQTWDKMGVIWCANARDAALPYEGQERPSTGGPGGGGKAGALNAAIKSIVAGAAQMSAACGPIQAIIMVLGNQAESGETRASATGSDDERKEPQGSDHGPSELAERFVLGKIDGTTFCQRALRLQQTARKALVRIVNQRLYEMAIVGRREAEQYQLAAVARVQEALASGNKGVNDYFDLAHYSDGLTGSGSD